MQEENIAIRLKFLITTLGINSSLFADNCGISRATLSQLLTGRNKKVNDILISQIHKAYPNLSILWLLFNEGPMWLNDHYQNNDSSTDRISEDRQKNNENSFINAFEISKTESELSSGTSMSSNREKKANEIQASPCPGQDEMKYFEETALKTPQSVNQFNDSQVIDTCKKNVELIKEIENLKSKIRKVVQITIYYDDSTFESFFPKS